MNNFRPQLFHFHSTGRQNSSGGEGGFTLMELIIVCLLAAIFLSVTIPSMRNSLLTNELNSTARKIIGTVGELRNMAIREHKPYLLHFDMDEQQLWYELDGSTDIFGDKTKPGLKLPEGIRIDDVYPSTQEKTNGGEVILWISNKGYMDQTVVHLSDGSGTNLTLFFSPFSGSARVYDDYVEAE